MMQLDHLWRRIGGGIAALALAVLLLGPSLDASICVDELSVADSAASQQGQSLDASNPTGDNDVEKEVGACVHGHCHHAAPTVPAALIAAYAPASLAQRHALYQAADPPRGLTFELKRPPRA